MILRFFIAILALYSHSIAVAALGASPSYGIKGSDLPAKRMATIERLQFSTYKVERSVQESGLLVSEFTNPDGVVFAVAWQGPILPDLKVLLGLHFGTFMASTEGATRTRSLGSPMVVKTDAVVIQSLGRMRGFRGYAYMPSLVPANVLITDVLQ